MKKQLFSLHDEVAAALDNHKKTTGTDKSAFVDAVIARELNVSLPEDAVDRKAALETAPAQSVPEMVAEADKQREDEAIEEAGKALYGDKPAEPEFTPNPPAAAFQTAEAPKNSTAFETTGESSTAIEDIMEHKAETPAQGFKPPIQQPATAPAEQVNPTAMPLVEPVQSASPAAQQEEAPMAVGVRKCPTCGEEYDTPYCLNCL